MTDRLRLYYSLRSPYAWFAFERFEEELGALDLHLDLVPLFPTPENYPNDPVRFPNKLHYISQDVARLVRHYGLSFRMPPGIDTDWARAHAACLAAREFGAERRYALEAFRARWCRGLDVSLDTVISEVAERVGLDGQVIARGAADGALQQSVSENMEKGQREHRIFGVPTFVFRGQLYWGHDRMPMLRDAVRRSQQPQVPVQAPA